MTTYNVEDYASVNVSRKCRRKLTPAQAEIAKLEKSHLEQAFATQVKQVGLPEPEREVMLSANHAYRWDFVWSRYRLAVEINGGVWTVGGHSTGQGIIRDMTKLRIATLAGYRCFQFHGDAIEDGSAINTVEQFILNYRQMVIDEWAAIDWK
jgi:very-short-patch-repair endonuclease